jgi:hypothetical protein
MHRPTCTFCADLIPFSLQFGFYRRERPELRTNEAGDPTFLITGIEYFADHPGEADNHQFSFTIVQEVDLSGGFIPGAQGAGAA